MKMTFQDEINKYAIQEAAKVQKALFQSTNIIFYDTNSFAYHSIEANGRFYALDFFDINDTVVFTDIVLSEISANDDKRYLIYFEELRKKVKNIIILNNSHFESILTYNHKNSISRIIIHQSFIEAFENYPDLKKKIKQLKIVAGNFTDELYKIFELDCLGKNKGEISIFISAIIAANIKKGRNIKIFSDDYKAYVYMSHLISFLQGNVNEPNVGLCSIPRNIQILYNSGKINSSDVDEYFKNIKCSNNANIYHKKLGFDTIYKGKFETKDLVVAIINKNLDIVF